MERRKGVTLHRSLLTEFANRLRDSAVIAGSRLGLYKLEDQDEVFEDAHSYQTDNSSDYMTCRDSFESNNSIVPSVQSTADDQLLNDNLTASSQSPLNIYRDTPQQLQKFAIPSRLSHSSPTSNLDPQCIAQSAASNVISAGPDHHKEMTWRDETRKIHQDEIVRQSILHEQRKAKDARHQNHYNREEYSAQQDRPDLDEIKVENMESLDPYFQAVISAEAQKYRLQYRPSRGLSYSSSSFQSGQLRKPEDPSTHIRDVKFGDEADNYCCDIARLAVERKTAGVDFCPSCQAVFCASCWQRQLPHKGGGTKGHEKTNLEVAKWVSTALDASYNDEEQAMRHLVDNNTTLWFGAGPGDHGTTVFRDFGRYGNLMTNTRDNPCIRRFPALVAFVGETGAGKSSLIKLLISMFGKTSEHQTPVVGPAVNEDVPTSSDVHLYSDPNTMHSSDPILYADCEGLNGGTRDPIAARFWRSHSGNSETRRMQSPGARTHIRQNHTHSEREIVWANTPEKSSRRYVVRHLYPRLLYTFSDVIVFVVKNVRAIENVVEQLIVWAEAVLEASSNQPVLPRAIIVLNASENQDEPHWDVHTSTQDLLEKVGEAMITNPRMKAYMRYWWSRGVFINDIKQLLLSYYSSVRVIRVPAKNYPTLIHNQIRRLYEEIKTSANASLEFKLSVRIKLTSEELHPYLQTAFDHFCRTLKSPFDFVKVSYANNAIPSDLGGNILKLSLKIMAHWGNRMDGSMLFKELSFMLASCVMLDAVRRGILGLAEGILPHYIQNLDAALEDFCDRYWPCEYICEDGRCVNVRAGHSKGHQLASAQIREPNAAYQSSFMALSYRQTFLDNIFFNLELLLGRLGATKKDRGWDKGQEAIEIHESMVLRHFYRHIGGAENFTSNSVCLSCLIFAPQHCLPCGHMLCTPCIEAFGSQRGLAAFDLSSCPLHTNSTFDSPFTASVHPKTAGVRVLALDGGGIRGIMELISLQHIERELGGVLRVQSFFDFIVGTSTGGIIALGIGEKNCSVNDCVSKFMSVASKIFSRNRTIRLSAFDTLFKMIENGKYDTNLFENVLMESFGNDPFFGRRKGRAQVGLSLCPKIAITATNGEGIPYLFANYNRPDAGDYPGYVFVRAERPEHEMKIYEVARATSAAPRIFKPFVHTQTKQSFRDGGMYYNNPIEIAMQELKLAFPDIDGRDPDIVISLGAGLSAKKAKTADHNSVIAPREPLSYLRRLIKDATDHVQLSIESERKWEEFVRFKVMDTKSRFFRINFMLDEKCPKPDNVSRMHYLKDLADEKLKKRQAEIRTIAHRLIASSFYFHPSCVPRTSNGTLILQGRIECRFLTKTREIEDLGAYLLRKQRQPCNILGAEEGPFFVFQEHGQEDNTGKIFMPTEMLKKMKNEGIFGMKEQIFIVTNPLASLNLSLVLDQYDCDKHFYPISGFPGCWNVKTDFSLRPPLSLSKRRAQSSQQSRRPWSKPASKHSWPYDDAFESYASSELPGLATESDISYVSKRLSKLYFTLEDTGLKGDRSELRHNQLKFKEVEHINGMVGEVPSDAARNANCPASNDGAPVSAPEPAPSLAPVPAATQSGHTDQIHPQYPPVELADSTIFELADTSVPDSPQRWKDPVDPFYHFYMNPPSLTRDTGPWRSETEEIKEMYE